MCHEISPISLVIHTEIPFDYLFLRDTTKAIWGVSKLTHWSLVMPWCITTRSVLVQVMVWHHEAPSHYLNQCWFPCHQWIPVAFIGRLSHIKTSKPDSLKCIWKIHSQNQIHISQRLMIWIYLHPDVGFHWLLWHLPDDKAASVEVMAWCHYLAATSHHLNQCWPRITMPSHSP